MDAAPLFNQPGDAGARPQQVGQRQLLGRVFGDQPEHQSFLPRIKQTAVADLVAVRGVVQPVCAANVVALADSEDPGTAQPGPQGDLVISAARLAQLDHHHATVVAGFAGQRSHVHRSHAFIWGRFGPTKGCRARDWAHNGHSHRSQIVS